MAGGGIFFGFMAGVVSTLSPCVLPLLPLVLGAAAAAHKFGMLALAAGMVVSFTGIGLFVATIGFSAGLTGDVFRIASAVLLGAMGIVLLSGPLSRRFALAAGGLGNAGNRLIDRLAPPGPKGSGLWGQALTGVVLGAIWSPCVGPTLGAASVLASRGQDLGMVAAVMMAFGAGAAVPLVVIGSLSREALIRWRGRLLGAGSGGKHALGLGAIAISALVLTGLDHVLETLLLNASPAWLTELTTRF